jgi:hypothetical protein
MRPGVRVCGVRGSGVGGGSDSNKGDQMMSTATMVETGIEIPAAIRERVTRGAEMLDRLCCGWAGMIDLRIFDFSRCSRCVLGQIYGEYSDGLKSIGFDLKTNHKTETDADYGFDRYRIEDWDVMNQLAAAWRDAIRERLEFAS